VILGVILAGGASRRMGRDKALVEVAGAPMIERVAAALEPITDTLLVAGRTDSLAGLETIPDEVEGPVGPLAGVAAALGTALTAGGLPSVVLAVAVNHPFVRQSTLRQLVIQHEGRAVVPIDGEVRQVTCAVYPASWAAAARRELQAGGSLQSLLDRMPHRLVTPDEWEAWGEDGRSWFSVDDEPSLAEGLARFGSTFE
jgi:molybdopterin-guanine dinucleotide biosynthesis protein A